MDNNIKITVGLPVFKAGNYLKYAIGSVLAQTYPNFELIIILDGTNDNSQEIAGNFHDPRIRLVIENENKGIAFRLNQQVGLARGFYFARMDADDIMFPERIEKQLTYMIENPETDVIGSQAIAIDNSNQIIGLREWDPVLTSRTVQKKSLFIHPTVFGKTSWFLSNPYDPEYEGVEDYYLWNSTFSRSKFSVMSEPLLFYRDPPEIKVSTYLNRQKQMRKALKSLMCNSVITSGAFRKLFILSKLKSVVYCIFSKLGLSGKLISARNIHLKDDEMVYYYDKLSGIINHQ